MSYAKAGWNLWWASQDKLGSFYAGPKGMRTLRKRGVGLGHPHHEFGKVNTDALVDRRYPLGTFISS